MVNKPQPGIGRSTSYVVGTGGTAEIQGADSKKTSDDKRWKGTQKWKRSAFNALNAAGAAGAGGGSVNP